MIHKPNPYAVGFVVVLVVCAVAVYIVVRLLYAVARWAEKRYIDKRGK